MALHRRFRPVFKKYAPRGTARFAKPLQGPFSLVAKHPQKHKNRPEIGRFSHFNPGAEMHLFSLFSASKSPEKWLYDAICRKKQLFAGSFGSRSHSSCSFTPHPLDHMLPFCPVSGGKAVRGCAFSITAPGRVCNEPNLKPCAFLKKRGFCGMFCRAGAAISNFAILSKKDAQALENGLAACFFPTGSTGGTLFKRRVF